MSDENQQQPQVVDLGTFINLLTDWHKTKLEFLLHMKDIPEGMTITINDGEPVEMSGELLQGFKLAMGIAVSELGTLPISRGHLIEIPDTEELHIPSPGEVNGTIH